MVFTPTSVKLGDQDYTPDELRAEIGDLADPFLAQQKLCVSDAIPAALSLGDVDVVARAAQAVGGTEECKTWLADAERTLSAPEHLASVWYWRAAFARSEAEADHAVAKAREHAARASWASRAASSASRSASILAARCASSRAIRLKMIATNGMPTTSPPTQSAPAPIVWSVRRSGPQCRATAT